MSQRPTRKRKLPSDDSPDPKKQRTVSPSPPSPPNPRKRSSSKDATGSTPKIRAIASSSGNVPRLREEATDALIHTIVPGTPRRPSILASIRGEPLPIAAPHASRQFTIDDLAWDKHGRITACMDNLCKLYPPAASSDPSGIVTLEYLANAPWFDPEELQDLGIVYNPRSREPATYDEVAESMAWDYDTSSLLVLHDRNVPIKIRSSVIRLCGLFDFPLLRRLESITVAMNWKNPEKYIKKWMEVLQASMFDNGSVRSNLLLYFGIGLNTNMLIQLDTRKRLAASEAAGVSKTVVHSNHWLVTLNFNTNRNQTAKLLRELKRYSNRAADDDVIGALDADVSTFFSILKPGYVEFAGDASDQLDDDNILSYNVVATEREIGPSHRKVHYHLVLELRTMVLEDQYAFIKYGKLRNEICHRFSTFDNLYINFKPIKEYSGRILDYLLKDSVGAMEVYNNNKVI